MNTVYLLLGSNLGERLETMQQAAQLAGQRIGSVVKASGFYETAPWGITDQPSFLNQVLRVETRLTVQQVLAETQTIERALGRQRKQKWGARLIDIDILYFNEAVIEQPNLYVPHPFLHQRRFTLVPLAEIAPDFVHPVLHKTTTELLAECPDAGAVTPYKS